MDTTHRMWGGRFSEGPAPELDRLNRSLPVDRRLWREDLRASQAWVTALAKAGALSEPEARSLRGGLAAVRSRLGAWSEHDWAAAPDEDIHTLVERLLGEELGELAGKLHTGRSRNDLVATDTRLWALGAASRLDGQIARLQGALLAQAEASADLLMPAYTHLQRAQPVSAAHWLLSHLWPLARDRERLAEACQRVAALPLGSGAVAGSGFPVDRVLLKEVLGFRTVSPNSIDAVGDRDWAAELLFVTALLGVHLSRLAEDLITYASSEFGFVRLSERFSTGSSLMPQKRNPDALELARARAARAIGDLTGLLSMLKALPSGYNKDLQEDKEALLRAFDSLADVLPAVTGTVATLAMDAGRCAAAVDSAMLATDVADALVERGVPFREAHGAVGALVRRAEAGGVPLAALGDDALAELGPRATGLRLAELLDPARSVARKRAAGGTGAAALADQLAAASAAVEGGSADPAGGAATPTAAQPVIVR
ncbi:MAG: argininosuccinate lyase [Gemmatimonadota bacterium]